MARRPFRFAFRIVSGPCAGHGSVGWRLWVHDESVYLTAKSLDGTWKVSLHGDVAWRLAVTSEHLKTSHAPVWRGSDRAPWKFEPPDFVDGRRLCFVVAATRAAMLPSADTDDFDVVVEDRWDQLTSVFVWMTDPGIGFNEVGLIAGPFPLASGRRVWVTQERQKLPLAQPHSDIVGVLVEPLWPDHDNVTAPGLLLKGLRWDS